MLSRLDLAICGLLIASLAFPFGAQGAVVSADPGAGSVLVRDDESEINRAHLDVAATGDEVVVSFSDSAATPTAGAGCVEGGSTVSCTIPELEQINVDLGNGDDYLDAISEPTRVILEARMGPGDDEAILGPGGAICGGFTCAVLGNSGSDRLVGSDDLNDLEGGAGDDTVLGGDLGNRLSGGPGDDLVKGGAGPDFIRGRDPGDDRLMGRGGEDLIDDRGGADLIRGGAGGDQLKSFVEGPRADDSISGGRGVDIYIRGCGGCNVSMDGTANDGAVGSAEADNVLAETFEVAVFEPDQEQAPDNRLGKGSDRLEGNDRSNEINANQGPDTVIGGSGSDLLTAGPGADIVRAADGQEDKDVRCGPGRDRAIVDRVDDPTSCEVVVVRGR